MKYSNINISKHLKKCKVQNKLLTDQILPSFHYLLGNIWMTPGFTVYDVFIIYWRIYGRPQVLQFSMFSLSTGEYMDDPRFNSFQCFHYLLKNIWTTPGFTVVQKINGHTVESWNIMVVINFPQKNNEFYWFKRI